MRNSIITLAAVFTAALAVLACSQTANAAKPKDLRIGSYNLRMQQLDKGDNDWSVRRGRVIRSIMDNKFDVFGVQELTDFACEQLKEDLADTYECIFFSPYSQDGKGSKAQGIIFNKKRFKLIEYHYFWPSGTPFEMSLNDHYTDGSGKSFKRGGICAVLKDKVSGRKIFFMNSHAALNKEENFKYAHVFVDMEKQFNPKGYPSFFVGDLNARPEHPTHGVLRAHWSDCADSVSERPCTFNAFKTDPKTWDKSRNIDYIYYRNISEPVKFECNQSLYDGFCASDHFPIWADFKI